MKKIFTLALVLILGLSMSAQKKVTSKVQNNQSVGLMSAYVSNNVLKTKKVDLNTGFVKSNFRTGLYNAKSSYVSESFDTEIPATWTVNNTGTGTLPGWFWENTDGSSPLTGFAWIDSDENGSGETTEGELITPAFDCSAASGVRLEFDTRYNDYSGDVDSFKVFVWDGTAWQNVIDWEEDHGTASTPEHVVLDISTYKNADCKVKFFYTDGGGYDWYAGVDNVAIYDVSAHDLSMEDLTPENVASGNTVVPTVTISNKGANVETAFMVVLTDGGTYNDTVNYSGSLAVLADTTLSFSAWTPADGTYNLVAAVTLAGDLDNSNDTLKQSVTVTNLIAMHTGNDTICSALFYDSGLDTADYQNSEDYLLTIYPSVLTNKVRVHFLSGEIEDGWDYLYVYDTEDTTGATPIATLTGSIADQTFTASVANTKGALTFVFLSDGSAARSGWEAEISCFVPPQHDLAINTVTPSFVQSGTSVIPTVTVENRGLNDENSYSISYTNKDASYTGTLNIADLLASTKDTILSLPSWSPADGFDTLTIAVVLPTDEDNTNDTLEKPVFIGSYDTAYVGNSTKELYCSLKVATGDTTNISSYSKDPFPMAEEFDGTNLYRLNSDLTIGIVNPIGEYSNLGTITGFAGTPVGLAWSWYTRTMYLEVLDASGISHLCTLDMATLVATEIGAGTGTVIAMDFAVDGNLYAPILEDKLVKIDLATGATTEVGDLGVDIKYGQDVSYNLADSSLYSVISQASGNSKYGTYNLTTGAFAEIKDMGADQYATVVMTKNIVTDTVVFTVTDGTDSLEGAAITVGAATFTTDSNGQVVVYLPTGASASITSMFGYSIDTTNFTVGGGSVDVNITLTELSKYDVTFNVFSSQATALQNVAVIVTYGTDTVSNGSTDATGKYVATGLYPYKYNYSLSLVNYSTKTDTVVVVDQNVTVNDTLSEAMDMPYGLIATQVNYESDVVFSWNNSTGFSDDFESYNDFELSFGDWILIDGDGGPTYGFNSTTFTNMNAPMAGIIFNPSQTSPALTGCDPHSGDKFVAIFNSSNPTLDDDWVIAPKTTVIANDEVSFWARSGVDASYIDEKLQVYVSTTTPVAASFTSISPIVTTTQTWTQYTYSLDAYAGQDIYVAIHCTSADQFFVCIDDFNIGQSSKSRALQSYTVLLDDSVKATGLDTNTFTFDNLADGHYVAGVFGVYETGNSDTATVAFDVAPNKIDDLGGKIYIYPNPTAGLFKINAKANYSVVVMDINGRIIYTSEMINNSTTIDLSSQNAGVYLVRLSDGINSQVIKVVKK